MAHTGILASLWLPADKAQALARPGGEPPEALHLTLAFVPNGAQLPPDNVAAIIAALRTVAENHKPITGKVAGIGRFKASATSDGKDVIYASYDAPDLPEFRQAVVEAIEATGIEISRAHGYTPHITLAYVEPEQATPSDVPEVEITFAGLSVSVAEMREEFAFEQAVSKHHPGGKSHNQKNHGNWARYRSGAMARPQRTVKPKGSKGKGGAGGKIGDFSLDTIDDHNKVADRARQLRDDLDYWNSNESAGQTKARIAQTLGERLKDDEDFMSLAKVYAGITRDPKTMKPEEIASQAVHTWAVTSGDSDPDAVAFQYAVQKEFGLTDASVGHLGRTQAEIEKNYTPQQMRGMQKLARAQYEETQQWFADRGITSVPAIRGAAWNSGELPSGMGAFGFDGTAKNTTVQLQPISSFSANADTAVSFTRGAPFQMLMAAEIPVSRIFSTCQTGFGCKNEAEMVVLGGKQTAKAVMYRQSDQQKLNDLASGWEAVINGIKVTKAAPKETTISIDASLGNADWTKANWDLPPYKSDEFNAVVPDTKAFQKLPIYQAAVDAGLIADDKWTGKKGKVKKAMTKPRGVLSRLLKARETLWARAVSNTGGEENPETDGNIASTAEGEPNPSGEQTVTKRWDVDITKRDDEKRLVFGWAAVAYDLTGKQVRDLQDDLIDEPDLEDLAYKFVLNYREGGEMHVKGGSAVLVESMVFTKEKQQALGIPQGTIPVGWWIGFLVTDEDAWELIKAGEYQAFSIEGTAVREPVND